MPLTNGWERDRYGISISEGGATAEDLHPVRGAGALVHTEHKAFVIGCVRLAVQVEGSAAPSVGGSRIGERVELLLCHEEMSGEGASACC